MEYKTHTWLLLKKSQTCTLEFICTTVFVHPVCVQDNKYNRTWKYFHSSYGRKSSSPVYENRNPCIYLRDVLCTYCYVCLYLLLKLCQVMYVCVDISITKLEDFIWYVAALNFYVNNILKHKCNLSLIRLKIIVEISNFLLK